MDDGTFTRWLIRNYRYSLRKFSRGQIKPEQIKADKTGTGTGRSNLNRYREIKPEQVQVDQT